MSRSDKPMDESAPEVAEPVMTTNTARWCWAMETLVYEVTDLFPDVTYEISHFTGWNVALDVTFVVAQGEDEVLLDLLPLLVDPAYAEQDRIEEVLVDHDQLSVLVSFVNNPQTKDSREPFGLSDAYDVLTDDER